MRRLYHERLEKKAFKMSIVLMLRDLEPQERSRMIDELTERTFKIPFSNKQTLSRSVIYQWLSEYSQATDRANVLVPKERTDRDKFRCLSTAQKNALLSWRSANPYRTAAQLREELLAHAATNSTPIPSESTIARFLRSVHLDRKTLLQKGTPQAKTRLAYESPILSGSGWLIPKVLTCRSGIPPIRFRPDWLNLSCSSMLIPVFLSRPVMCSRKMNRQ